MRLIDPIKISYNNLMAAKFRSFLTILGIIIGVASVIIVMAIGAGAQEFILSQIKKAGSNVVAVFPGAAEEKGPPPAVMGVVSTTFVYDDLKAITNQKNVPNVIAASGFVTGSATIKSDSDSFQASYQGVSAGMPEVISIEVIKGRFFDQEEETNLSRIAVLGFNRANELFPNQDPIGKSITIKDLNFIVIGVLEEKGSSGFSNPDDTVFVPLWTAQKVLLGINHLNYARIKVNEEQNLDQAMVDIKKTLRTEHKLKDDQENDFMVQNSAQALSMISKITDILKYFMASIAAISLLVGGIGIMNIMLIAVNQRIREIGLRKAVGAKNSHIVFQFLIESITVTLAGGIVGIIIGVGISFLAYYVIITLGYTWFFIITWQSITLGVLVTFLVGLIFGMYPARKAAKVSPMEALRYE